MNLPKTTKRYLNVIFRRKIRYKGATFLQNSAEFFFGKTMFLHAQSCQSVQISKAV